MNATIRHIKSAVLRFIIREIPLFRSLFQRPFMKRTLMLFDLFQGELEEAELVTYEDKINFRGPLYNHRILFGQEGHDLIGELISRNQPCMVSRLGSVELSCLHYFREKRGYHKAYPCNITSSMTNPAGFFPTDDASLDAFAELYFEELKQVDLMGVWFNHYESIICNRYSEGADLVELHSLEPFHFANPWSARLAGKKVLVVHPFEESMRKQYAEKRQLLFADPAVLPEFELKTVKAVQSIAGSKVKFATWFDAYRHMCDEMSRVDFDICIIGAGAYGLPLASFAKKLGKQAIHMGGASQLLFGIKGKRWEEAYGDSTAQLFNEH